MPQQSEWSRRECSDEDKAIRDNQFDLLLANLKHLTEWECGFVASAYRYRHHLTEKQLVIVERLFKQVGHE